MMTMKIATGEIEDPHVNQGKRAGGIKGAAARSKALTKERRKEIAQKAAAASTGRFMEVPRVQIYTVDDFFEGRRPRLPMVA